MSYTRDDYKYYPKEYYDVMFQCYQNRRLTYSVFVGSEPSIRMEVDVTKSLILQEHYSEVYLEPLSDYGRCVLDKLVEEKKIFYMKNLYYMV